MLRRASTLESLPGPMTVFRLGDGYGVHLAECRLAQLMEIRWEYDSQV